LCTSAAAEDSEATLVDGKCITPSAKGVTAAALLVCEHLSASNTIPSRSIYLHLYGAHRQVIEAQINLESALPAPQ